jgi:hypothetical protein
VAHRPGDCVAFGHFGEDATLDHSLGQLLNEQRDAIGPIDNLVGDLLGERLATANVGCLSQTGTRRTGLA